jgi:hypothetical protein
VAELRGSAPLTTKPVFTHESETLRSAYHCLNLCQLYYFNVVSENKNCGARETAVAR